MTKTIRVYSTDGCPYCTITKEYFTSKGVAFEEVNVGNDRAAAQEMIMKSGQMGVPVIDIDGKIIVGFRPDVFEAVLTQ